MAVSGHEQTGVSDGGPASGGPFVTRVGLCDSPLRSSFAEAKKSVSVY